MKNQLRDIIPPNERSIRNIPIPKRSIHMEVVDENDEAPAPEPTYIKQPPRDFSGEPRPGRRMGPIWIVAIVCIIGVAFSISWLFASAEISITSKKFDIPISGNITAEKDDTGSLQYASITETAEEKVFIQGTGEKEVESKAKGRIAIFNNHSTSPQTLIPNTRFETSKGLIFRIEKQVTVPGMTTRNGEKVPGSVEADVIADKPGAEYNVGLTDFTIPGFKDDPKFNNFYARSKTSIGGGALGKIAIVNDQDLTEARDALRKKLTSDLVTKIKAEIPENFTFIEGIQDISFSSEDPTPSAEGAEVVEKASMKAYILNKDDFAQYVSQKSGVAIPSANTITFDGSKLAITDVVEAEDLSFNASGNLLISYEVDAADIKEKLRGKTKEESVAILGQYPGIEKAKTVLKPFWRGSVPDKDSKIEVIAE